MDRIQVNSDVICLFSLEFPSICIFICDCWKGIFSESLIPGGTFNIVHTGHSQSISISESISVDKKNEFFIVLFPAILLIGKNIADSAPEGPFFLELIVQMIIEQQMGFSLFLKKFYTKYSKFISLNNHIMLGKDCIRNWKLLLWLLFQYLPTST